MTEANESDYILALDIMGKCKILGIVDINLKKMIPPLQSYTENKWKKNISIEDQTKIYDILSPTLKKLDLPYTLG